MPIEITDGRHRVLNVTGSRPQSHHEWLLVWRVLQKTNGPEKIDQPRRVRMTNALKLLSQSK